MTKTNTFLYGRTQQQLLSLPNLIHWGDHFSLGHVGIDTQHKKIFDLGINVYKDWGEGGSIDKLYPATEKLARLLEAHFSYEERILFEIGYEELDEHAAEHKKILKDMEALQATMDERLLQINDKGKLSGGSVLSPSWPLMQFFLGFAVAHVSSSDMNFYKTLTDSQNPG